MNFIRLWPLVAISCSNPGVIEEGEGEGAEGEGEGDACVPEFDADEFAALQLEEDARVELVGPREALAGATVGYGLRLSEWCPTWSLSPDGAAQVGDDGIVILPADIPVGTIINIGATTAIGSYATSLTIIDPIASPLAGGFFETDQLSCSDGARLAATSPIGELVIGARGTNNQHFSVTWQADEEYIDYSGTFTINATTGDIAFTAENGIYIPTDIDGAGTFVIVDEETIELRDLWLGTDRNDTEAPGCGHVFRRRAPRP
jgi:hypothetical protein